MFSTVGTKQNTQIRNFSVAVFATVNGNTVCNYLVQKTTIHKGFFNELLTVCVLKRISTSSTKRRPPFPFSCQCVGEQENIKTYQTSEFGCQLILIQIKSQSKLMTVACTIVLIAGLMYLNCYFPKKYCFTLKWIKISKYENRKKYNRIEYRNTN